MKLEALSLMAKSCASGERTASNCFSIGEGQGEGW